MSCARLWRQRPKAVAAWLTLCGDLTGRLGVTLEALAGLPEGSVTPAQLSRWHWFHACSVRLQDQIRRRVLEGETIPHEEKLFSLFEAAYALDHEGQGRQACGVGGFPSNSPYSPNPAIGMDFAHWLSQ